MCMCAFLGTNDAHILYEVSEMLEKTLDLLSPVLSYCLYQAIL
jgi:hypothetical protein